MKKEQLKEREALKRLRQKMAAKDDGKPWMNPVPGQFLSTTVFPDGLTFTVVRVVPGK